MKNVIRAACVVWASCCFPALWSLLAAEPGADAKDAAERTRLTGTWRGFAVDGKGENPDRGPVKLELIFSAKTIHGIEFKGDTPVDQGEGEYVLDLAADQPQLDGVKTMLNGRKDVWLGIYKWEGERLYWCVAKRQRPTTFETVKGQFLMVFQRSNDPPTVVP